VLDVRIKRSVLVCKTHHFNVHLKVTLIQKVCDVIVLLTVYKANCPVGKKDCVTFVHPKMVPVLVCYQVSAPGMRHFMYNDISVGLVSNNKRRRSKCQMRILHSSERKTRGKNNDRILGPVVGKSDLLKSS